MARSSIPSASKPASSDALSKKSSTPASPAPAPATLKRKIDWATIDQDKCFKGFKLKPLYYRAPRKSSQTSNKRQKTGAPASGANLSNYRDASLSAKIVQGNPYEEAELSDIHIKIEPVAEWESLQRYRKFTIVSEEFEVGQTVFVKNPEEDPDTPDSVSQWFAKVLEVRAGDAAHVYLRVYWAYRPEDLPGGRQPHHGTGELIVSNHMDIIEAMTVDCTANLFHWVDDPDESEWPAKNQLFWRQSLDINKPKGKQLSELRTYCIDKAPCNPDEPLIHCPSCGEWLHAHCLEDQAVQDASTMYPVPQSVQPRSQSPSNEIRETVEESSNPQAFTANISTSVSGKTRLTIMDHRKAQNSQQWDVPVQCLLCKEIIEKVHDDFSPQPSEAQTPTTSSSYSDEEDGITLAPAAPKSRTPNAQGNQNSLFGTNQANQARMRSAPTTHAAEPGPATPTIEYSETSETSETSDSSSDSASTTAARQEAYQPASPFL